MRREIISSLIVILALCGCQNKELDVHTTESKPFIAAIDDNFSDVKTKTSLDNQGNVLWKKGDQISIFAGSTINEQYQVSDDSEGKTAAKLNKISESGFNAGGEISNNVAFYPYSKTASITKDVDAYVIRDIVLPSIQEYAENSFGSGAFPMAAVTNTTTDMNLKFKNILGGLKLQLKGTASIASISVTGNNNEVLCGAAEVTVANDDIPSINLTDATAKTVTLDCGSGVQLNASTATSFVIALPPMTMTGGFTVIAKDTEGKEMEIKTTKGQTIVRSNLLKMPEVTYEGVEHDYTKDPFTITSTGSTAVSINKVGSPADISLEYRKGSGNWEAYSIGSSIDLTDGEFVQFRAGEGGNIQLSKDIENYYNLSASGSGKVAASGNIMSLFDRNLLIGAVPSYGLFKFFYGCTNLTKAPELPATSLAMDCYDSMFEDCTSLTLAPELPATTLAAACYSAMFMGCTSLSSAPELPATSLAMDCYESMFEDCTSLTLAPELPATTLAAGCYSAMFMGCTSLSSAPELPATSLGWFCYSAMFRDCTSLTSAPELPATTLGSYCYSAMFMGCTGLLSAPELPATKVYDNSYERMFYGCTSLKTAPTILPATSLKDMCYSEMFHDCSSLETAPNISAETAPFCCCFHMFDNCTSLTSAPAKLAALTLENQCYDSMFKGCTSLTMAPELSATTLASYCYSAMFMGCTSLLSAPELPVTTLPDRCYASMFSGCTSLSSAPELPATTLAENCYYSMFNGCTRLNYVKALFTTTSSDKDTKNWLYGVSPTGTFVKSKDATWTITGPDGIPEGWTVVTE